MRTNKLESAELFCQISIIISALFSPLVPIPVLLCRLDFSVEKILSLIAAKLNFISCISLKNQALRLTIDTIKHSYKIYRIVCAKNILIFSSVYIKAVGIDKTKKQLLLVRVLTLFKLYYADIFARLVLVCIVDTLETSTFFIAPTFIRKISSDFFSVPI